MRIKNEKGITLVALVISIVIIIILAGISLRAVFGDNSIIEQTERGKEMHYQGEENDFAGQNAIYSEYMNIMSTL